MTKTMGKRLLLLVAVLALAAGGGLLAVKATTDVTEQAGYHVGTHIDLSDDGEVYTDATNTTVGKASTGRYAESDFVYKAVFAAGTTDAWMIFQTPYAAKNCKVLAATDPAGPWTTVLEATVDGDGNYVLPDDTSSLRGVHSAYIDYYVDLSAFMQAEGVSPVYVKFSKYGAGGNETNVHDLLFTEGKPLNPDGDMYAQISNEDMGTTTVVDDTKLLGHSTLLKNKSPIGLDVHLYFDGYAYALYEVIVPAGTTKVTADISFHNDVTVEERAALLDFYVGDRRVYTHSAVKMTRNTLDLTEALAEQLATGEEFRLVMRMTDSTPTGGNGPKPRLFAFFFEQPLSTVPGVVTKPVSGSDVVYEVADAFNVKEVTVDAGVAVLDDSAVNSGGRVENNDRVLWFSGAYNGADHAYFDNNRMGIFKLTYGPNLGKGELMVDVAQKHRISIAASEADALAMEGYRYCYTMPGYDTLSISTAGRSGKLYFDVSDYLDRAGGTLYVKLSNTTLYEGGGPLPYSMSLTVWQADTTEFVGQLPAGTVYANVQRPLALTLTKSQHEGVAGVTVDGTALTGDQYEATDNTLTLSAAYMATLNAGAHTIAVTSDYADATRSFSLTLDVAANAVTDLTVAVPPARTSFYTGETLDLTGGAITVAYASGDTVRLDMTAEGVTADTATAQATAGRQTVTLTYQGHSTALDITVEADYVTGIAVTALPDKTVYFPGEPLSAAGGRLTLTYASGKSGDLALDDQSVSVSAATVQTATGKQDITVALGELTATFVITVQADYVSGLTVTPPAKTQYAPGETLDLTGGEITVTYASGKVATVGLADEGVTVSVTAAQNSAGTQAVSVSYGGKTVTFDITVEQKADKGGCGSAAGRAALPLAGLLLAAVAALTVRRKREAQ